MTHVCSPNGGYAASKAILRKRVNYTFAPARESHRPSLKCLRIRIRSCAEGETDRSRTRVRRAEKQVGPKPSCRRPAASRLPGVGSSQLGVSSSTLCMTDYAARAADIAASNVVEY